MKFISKNVECEGIVKDAMMQEHPRLKGVTVQYQNNLFPVFKVLLKFLVLFKNSGFLYGYEFSRTEVDGIRSSFLCLSSFEIASSETFLTHCEDS
jgi:hypothetical protein